MNNHKPVMSFRCSPKTIILDAGVATSIALIVNELCTNAIKHADKAVELKVEEKGSELHVFVKDDGPGVPPDFNMSKDTGRFGLRMAARVAASCGGELKTIAGTGGAQFHLWVPIP